MPEAPTSTVVCRIASVVFCLAFVACSSSSVPTPPLMPQPAGAYRTVPYPPPPGRVEVVPEQPRDDAVWVDGGWAWVESGWAWQPGAWVAAGPGVFYSLWDVRFRSDGTVAFAPSAWRGQSGATVRPPPALAVEGSGDDAVQAPPSP